ncbi:MAG: hypothetical protein AB203_01920 [Parcubacteria bacterium C7867-008]|nr:MAG: hypothetical protein AB203_01920 [Parcubacteria bacterium C7867-008]
MTKQERRKALAREALAAVKDKAPTNVREMIIPHTLDEVAEYIGDIMGSLTNIDTKDTKATVMACGIIRDGLIREVISQLQEEMHDDLDARLKLFKEKK